MNTRFYKIRIVDRMETQPSVILSLGDKYPAVGGIVSLQSFYRKHMTFPFPPLAHNALLSVGSFPDSLYLVWLLILHSAQHRFEVICQSH